MKVQCLKLEYQPGSYELVQGVKGHQSGKKVGGKFFRSRGFGWGEHIQSSKLILHVKVGGEPQEIWIDRFFKINFGRLVEARRKLIAKAMPKEVNVEKKTSPRGTVYYQVLQVDLEEWLNRIR